MNTERDLLYGVLALQADLISTEQFVDACTAWSAQRAASLEHLLLEWGYLSPTDHRYVEFLRHRRLAKNAGDAQASLATISDERWRYALASLSDPYVQQVLSSMPRAPATDRAQAKLSIHDIDPSGASQPTPDKLAQPRSSRGNRATLAAALVIVVVGALSATYLLTRERSRLQELQAELGEVRAQTAEQRLRAERFAGESMAERERAAREPANGSVIRVEPEKSKAEGDSLRPAVRGAASPTPPVVSQANETETTPTADSAAGGEPLDSLLKTVEQLEARLETDPTNPALQRELAGRLTDAEAAARRALVTLEMTTDSAANRVQRAATHELLGRVFHKSQRLVEAEAAHRRALELREPLVKLHPENEEYLRALASSHQQLATIYQVTGRFVQAEAAAQRALSIREKLARDRPMRVELLREVALSQRTLGSIHLASRRFAQAEAAFGKAVAIVNTHDDALNHGWVAADLGVIHFELAGLHAVQAESGSKDQREQHATKAIEALERARTLGFFASAANRDRLNRAAQFDSLRKRDDFRKLLDSLKKPVPANG